MLFSEAVTSKQRFMQSSGGSGARVGESGGGLAAILICPARHSNRERSDTSINSPSSTKFTLVFRKAQYFISSCRISQSYFQSLTCHHGVAVRQLVVIMTIYSPGSEGAALPSAPPPAKAEHGGSTPSSHPLIFSYIVPSLLFSTICPSSSVELVAGPSTSPSVPPPVYSFPHFGFRSKNTILQLFIFFSGRAIVPQTVICPPLCPAPLVTGVTPVNLSQPSCRIWSFQRYQYVVF